MLSTSQILLSLLLLVPYTLADTSSPQAQEGSLRALLPDDDAPESSSGQVSASGWTTDKSSGPGFRLPQASNPVIDSSELPLAGESTDCDGTNPGQIQPTSRLRRSQLVGKREKTLCVNPQYQRSNPASGSGPGSGRSQTKGPGPGQQPRHPEPEAGVVQDLISRVRGVLGEANVAMCWSSDPYYRVPICVPISPPRVSPAATVEPARLWIFWDACDFLLEDLWCCSLAKERITIPDSTLFPLEPKDLSADWREPHMALTIEPTIEKNGYDESCFTREIPFLRNGT